MRKYTFESIVSQIANLLYWPSPSLHLYWVVTQTYIWTWDFSKVTVTIYGTFSDISQNNIPDTELSLHSNHFVANDVLEKYQYIYTFSVIFVQKQFVCVYSEHIVGIAKCAL